MALLDLVHDRLPLVCRVRRPSSCSRRSVMPDSAECTTTGRRPSASRSRTTAAMFFQLRPRKRWCRRTSARPTARLPGVGSAIVIVITPNETAAHRRGSAQLAQSLSGPALDRSRREPATTILLRIFEFFLQAPLRQHVLQLAPRGLAFLGLGRSAGARPAADRIDELFVTRSPRRSRRRSPHRDRNGRRLSPPWRFLKKFYQNQLDRNPGGAGSLRTIYDAPAFSMAGCDPRMSNPCSALDWVRDPEFCK